jgi:hypothetical protein
LKREEGKHGSTLNAETSDGVEFGQIELKNRRETSRVKSGDVSIDAEVRENLLQTMRHET